MKNAFRILVAIHSCYLIALVLYFKIEEPRNLKWLFYFLIGFTLISIVSLLYYEKITPKRKLLKRTFFSLNLVMMTMSFLYAFICLWESLARHDYDFFTIVVLTSFLVVVVSLIIALFNRLKGTTANNT